MKNFAKAYFRINEEQERYVQRIKDTIYRLLEANGSSQHIGNAVHNTFNLAPRTPRCGKEFGCETNGTGFTFTVSFKNGFIEAFGTIPGPAPVKMITKKWRSLEKLEKEFLQVFGECFYKNLSALDLFSGKKPVSIAAQ